jgi:hypothetical protein
MTDIEPQYDVVQVRGMFYVQTNGIEVTKGTRDKTLAERWARDLRRAAQVESERKRVARG